MQVQLRANGKSEAMQCRYIKANSISIAVLSETGVSVYCILSETVWSEIEWMLKMAILRRG
jgi:diphthamide biosynthesis methyltransferase